MANIKSAQKRAKQNEVRRKINLARKSSLKTAIKKVLTAITEQENLEATKELLAQAQAKIARARGKGVLHKNTAARKMSRLAKRVAQAQKEAQK